MESDKQKKKRNYKLIALIPIAVGILLNFAFAKLAAASGMPIYLDNIGTIITSALGGYLPGILTGVINNVLNYYLDAISIYYASISALFAIVTVNCYRRGWFEKISGIIRLILLLAVVGGVLGGIITWYLSGAATEGTAALWLEWCKTNLGFNTFWAHIASTFALDIIDKTITVLVAVVIVRMIPEKYRRMFWFSGWKQTPVTEEEEKLEKSLLGGGRKSLNTRIALMLIFATLSMALVVTGVSSELFTQYSKDQHMQDGEGAANLVAHEIDPEKVDEYIKKGEKAEGYKETEAELYEIRDNYPDMDYVYVYQIKKDGCHVVFDLDAPGLKGEEPGTVIPFDDSFKKLIPDLLAGKKIDPIETNDTYGWLLTSYQPIYDSKGKCVCYAAADIKVSEIKEYERNFAIRVVLLFLGFFILILVIGLWLAKYHVILPINCMATMANRFAGGEKENNEEIMESTLEQIHDLEIRTGDEVQNLYESFCTMTSDTVQHMHDMRQQSEEIAELQNGLIITMADMVDGRDSDTGNHVVKTAAYARIVLEGLRRNGYYLDQITDQYIDDVEHSAPLHDVGKISVSDVILNKPGKLTDEEFAIMKSHTTRGREMIDKVIETVNGASYLNHARDMAAYHHEKWNGTGYPEGLSGEDIPLSARVLAIADVFDALTAKRVYKDGMPFEKVVAIIQEDSGTHFDPKCVVAFMDSLDEIKAVLDYYNELAEEGIRAKEAKKESQNAEAGRSEETESKEPEDGSEDESESKDENVSEDESENKDGIKNGE